MRSISFLLSGLQMEVNRCQEDQKLSLPPMDNLFSRGIGVGAYCAVAIFEDLRKRLPLSNGRLDQTDVSSSALIKILKSSELTSGRGNQNKAILILSVLLGPSAFSSSFLWLQFL
ncbi:hypothetical protein AAG906_004780 [Vitis piasezkii]